MAFKTVLVCLNEVDRIPVLLNLAAGIAAKQNAHVVGLYVVPAVRVYPAIGPGMAAQVVEDVREFFNARSDQVKQQFEAHMRQQTIEAEWRLVDSSYPDIAAAVIEHGLQSDLIIVNQVNPESMAGIELDFTERVVMESGRPVLIVPSFGEFRECGHTVLVGWNATREAARAAFDSVPILRHAGAVRVAWVDPQESLDGPGFLPGAELATALARHGVKVTAEGIPTSGIGAGEALLSHASDLGADLLVMGAYGHNRLREYVFGGATRTILQSMTVPVLMSH
jgi:nucleotide-binding universal stress UspA family protein